MNVKEKWYPELQHYNKETPFLLIGTKMDIRNNNEILSRLMESNQTHHTLEISLHLDPFNTTLAGFVGRQIRSSQWNQSRESRWPSCWGLSSILSAAPWRRRASGRSLRRPQGERIVSARKSAPVLAQKPHQITARKPTKYLAQRLTRVLNFHLELVFPHNPFQGRINSPSEEDELVQHLMIKPRMCVLHVFVRNEWWKKIVKKLSTGFKLFARLKTCETTSNFVHEYVHSLRNRPHLIISLFETEWIKAADRLTCPLHGKDGWGVLCGGGKEKSHTPSELGKFLIKSNQVPQSNNLAVYKFLTRFCVSKISC